MRKMDIFVTVLTYRVSMFLKTANPNPNPNPSQHRLSRRGGRGGRERLQLMVVGAAGSSREGEARLSGGDGPAGGNRAQVAPGQGRGGRRGFVRGLEHALLLPVGPVLHP